MLAQGQDKIIMKTFKMLWSGQDRIIKTSRICLGGVGGQGIMKTS
jgi:hypothetical protein